MPTFPSITPDVEDNSDPTSYEFYTLFQVTAEIDVNAITFNSPTVQPGAAVALGEVSIAGLASVTGVAIAVGDNSVDLPDPVTLTPGHSYVVSIWLPASAHYAATASSAITEGPVTQSGTLFAFRQSGTGHIPYDGSASPSTNWFGVGFTYGEAALDALAFTVTKVDATHASIAWDDTDDTITNGVDIVRCAGDQRTTDDSDGDGPGEDGYDPTTISGTSTIVENVTDSPYVDTAPSSAGYTYWINRSADA